MKKFIITEQERSRILNMHISRSAKQYLMEYDIDDDNKVKMFNELTSDGGQEILNEIGITVTEDTDPEIVVGSLNNSDICQFEDMESFAEQKFGSKVREKFGDKAQELMVKIVEGLNGFVDMIKNFSVGQLKQLFKSLKTKKTEAEQKVGENDKLVVEFFGTSMALVTIFGSFTMPALVLTIASVVLVTLIGLYLLKSVLCAFNISFKSIKRCRIRSFEWGQCN
tara:strand:+ start:176 stop:847 length:672 start_codon:yes stop_codon:yes gene_type:complete